MPYDTQTIPQKKLLTPDQPVAFPTQQNQFSTDQVLQPGNPPNQPNPQPAQPPQAPQVQNPAPQQPQNQPVLPPPPPGQPAQFYKPDPTNPQVFDANGNPLSFDAYKAAGGKGVLGQGDFPDVIAGPPPKQPNQLQPTQSTQPTQTQPLTVDTPTTDSAQNQIDPGSIQGQVDALMKEWGFSAPPPTQDPFTTYTNTYSQVFTSLGLPTLKTQIDTVTKSYNDLNKELADKVADVNDNPWLDDGTRQARISKLQDRYNGKMDPLTQQLNLYQGMYSQGTSQAEFVAGQIFNQFHTDQVNNKDLISKAITTAVTSSIAQDKLNLAQSKLDQAQTIANNRIVRIGTDDNGNPVYGPSSSLLPASNPQSSVNNNTQFTLGPDGKTVLANGNAVDLSTFQKMTGQQVQPDPSKTDFSMVQKSNNQTPQSAAAVNDPLGLKPGGQFSQFDTGQQGFQAGVDQIQSYMQGTGPVSSINADSPLSQFVPTWITGNPNSTSKTGYTAQDVASYLKNVVGINGVTKDTPLYQIGAQNLAQAVAHFETGYDSSTGTFAGQPTPPVAISGNTKLNMKGFNPNSNIDSQALQLVTGKTAPSQLSKRATVYGSILKRAGQIDPQFSSQLAENYFKSQGAALTQQTEFLQTMKRAVSTVDSNLSILTQAADKVNKNNSPLVNEWTNLAQRNIIGNGDLVAYTAALQTVRNEYQFILARGGQVTDTVRGEAQDLIPNNINKDQLMKAINVLKQEGQNVLSSAQTVVNNPNPQTNQPSQIDLHQFIK